MSAKIVVFEGADKVGKETLSRLAERSLQGQGKLALRVEPAKEAHPWGRKLIYWMLTSGWAKRLPNTFQFVQFLNKVFFQVFRLPKLARQNDIILVDRWALSGFVYGSAENINPWLNYMMYYYLKQADLTIVVSGNSYRRSSTTDDSYEKDTDLQARVKASYEKWASILDKHALVLNQRSVDEVLMNVLDLIGALPA